MSALSHQFLTVEETEAMKAGLQSGGVMEGYVRRKPHNPHKVPRCPLVMPVCWTSPLRLSDCLASNVLDNFLPSVSLYLSLGVCMKLTEACM